MTTSTEYPLRPFIGVDCSGQPKQPPMIAVATRWSRKERQNRWIVSVADDEIAKYREKVSDWQEKMYAALFFKAIDRILVRNYEIQIDKECHGSDSQKKLFIYLKRLFGIIHYGEIEKQNPEITFHTKEKSGYVEHADKKTKLARKGKMRINEKNTKIGWLMELLK